MSEVKMEEKTADLEFAKLDLDRKERTGFGEVVFCQGKSDEHLVRIYETLLKKEGEVLGTRASLAQAELLRKELESDSRKTHSVAYDKVSRLLVVRSVDGKRRKAVGNIAVCSAGTADIPVAEEAAGTAEFFGGNVHRFFDVGVAGIHRLLDKVDEIRGANVVIAVAGMEGALASVLGGLVKVPVICVPTSVGYGANLRGISTLLSMINSCANGISVVNIDNGFGAGYIATQINRLAEGIK